MSDLINVVEQSLNNTVAKPPSVGVGGVYLVQYLARAGLSMYPWWSPLRDIQLANFWKKVDYLSGAIYTMESKMSSIPVRIQSRDQSVKEYVYEAERETERLLMGAELGNGWTSFYEKFVEALITQDNGTFAEIIGQGNKAGPIIGRPITVRTLDPALCQRTGDPLYPVIYHDTDGKMYKLHFTRVMFKAQMESTIAQMFGVGFCGISRAINTSQSLLDILVYKQEKLGSRPRRAVMTTGGGLDPEDIADAFNQIEAIEDSQGLSRYSKIAVVGDSSLPDARITLTDLSSLPDGYDERTNIELGMATIAMALGMDARELFPAIQSGATRADALIQHLKQRGKGPGQIIQMTELMFNAKYLPPYLKMVFDFQDDEEDRQTAETKNVRANRWSIAIKDGSMDTHTSRAQMVEVGDLERGQFERLELQDGRLPDGTSVLALFYSKDQRIKKYLKLPIDNPLDNINNNWESMKDAVNESMSKAMDTIVNSTNPEERWSALKAIAALKELTKLYNPKSVEPAPKLEEPDENMIKPDKRMRREDLMRPKPPEIEVDELEPDRDEQRAKEAGEKPSQPF